MSQFYFNPANQAASSSHLTFPNPANAHAHHASRSRRSTRYSSSQTSHRPFKNPRTHKDTIEAAHVAAIRKDFEAARSFDLEDDEVFCPWHLLTDDDLQSIHSSSSDRSSSSASGSPETSPLQPQLQPTPTFSLSAAISGPSHPHLSAPFQQGATGHLKLHQPLAQRTRNAIPIVDPNSRTASPPTSLSPARQAQKVFMGRRW